MLERMKRMGIDFGTKKVGIALTDDAGVMAFPHAVWPNDAELRARIEELAIERGVEEIVIGHSLDNQGNPNPVHKAVEALITELTLSLGLPIHLEPEQYSTQQAKQIQGQTDQTDAAAAALILDSYITKKANH